jgi:hypothetical protein
LEAMLGLILHHTRPISIQVLLGKFLFIIQPYYQPSGNKSKAISPGSGVSKEVFLQTIRGRTGLHLLRGGGSTNPSEFLLPLSKSRKNL